MKTAYFDCFSGISGDMMLGALVDVGADIVQIEAELRRLPVSGWKISAEKVKRGGLAATRVLVETSEHHHHRSLSTILNLIQQAGLAPRVVERASSIFTRLGEAEARMHGVPIERVHFHEVGAVDAIVDIVGTSVGFESLAIDECVCSRLNVGGGMVKAAHGNLPVPAPATAELLRGAPTYSNGILHELVTPTGAAIVRTLASSFGTQPAMSVSAIGYGAGATELAEQPNVLRIMIGESATQEKGALQEGTIVVLEANVDDMNPQLYGYFAERALEAGALDVFSTSIQMKKNRPGQLVTVLCDAAKTHDLTELILRETTTIGVRHSTAGRHTLQRESISVKTPLGSIAVKVARLNGKILNAVPEYEECRKFAMEHSLPLKEVIGRVMFEFQKQQGPLN
jgi:pyridinium-3,5-bisthiocarboxylic acid mononucleotide nickel chelatase